MHYYDITTAVALHHGSIHVHLNHVVKYFGKFVRNHKMWFLILFKKLHRNGLRAVNHTNNSMKVNISPLPKHFYHNHKPDSDNMRHKNNILAYGIIATSNWGLPHTV